MATPVKMPELGESITEGTITRWLKEEGDQVEADEPLFEVSTDKVDTEVPSPVAGVLKTIKVQADETVEVGAELAIIEQDGESGGEDKSDESAESADDTADEAAEAGEGSEEAGSEEERESEAAEAESEDEDEGKGEEPEAEEQPKPKAEASGDGGTTTVTMPELGESITEGTITRWLKEEGDQVEADEPLFEISTDKVDTEVPSPVAGVLQSIKVQADETVEVGAELAVIGGGGDSAEATQETEETEEQAPAREETAEEGAGAEAEEAAKDQEQEAPAEPAPEREAEPAAKAKPERSKGNGQGNGKAAAGVSPLVRRLAREHDVDLSQIQGS
ncbi:MAG TPA: biotin/lipoyl-containing protein, partial [Actinomycetota bacterium]|nr:biotin/lipoyl-containing protein [Actinomycetota bacterium]